MPPPTTPPPPVAGSPVEQAIADLAARLDVDPTTIEVVSVDEVDWPDASIGCPQPGMVYAQVITNGSKIVLRHDDVEYDYHQAGLQPVFYCPPDRVVDP
jgi:hypothetical protein